MHWRISLLLLIMSGSVQAAYVVNNAGRQIHGTHISATAAGDITLTMSSGQTMTFRKGQYRSATADRPKELARAAQWLQQGQSEQALPLLKKVKERYRHLAWDQMAIQQLADFYLESGQFLEAVAAFQSLEDQSRPSHQKKLREALMKCGDTATVLIGINEDIARGTRTAAAQAYLMRGKLKQANGDSEGARRDWLKVYTFFKAQKESAAQAEELLRLMHDFPSESSEQAKADSI
ncbi:MAG: hypothetical protein V5783_11305 [Pontiella sp.]